jgi:hypothetical protein
MAPRLLRPSHYVRSNDTIIYSSLQRYIRDAILRSAAVALKRLALSMTYNATPQLLALVQNLADPASSSQSVHACVAPLT